MTSSRKRKSKTTIAVAQVAVDAVLAIVTTVIMAPPTAAPMVAAPVVVVPVNMVSVAEAQATMAQLITAVQAGASDARKIATNTRVQDDRAGTGWIADHVMQNIAAAGTSEHTLTGIMAIATVDTRTIVMTVALQAVVDVTSLNVLTVAIKVVTGAMAAGRIVTTLVATDIGIIKIKESATSVINPALDIPAATDTTDMGLLIILIVDTTEIMGTLIIPKAAVDSLITQNMGNTGTGHNTAAAVTDSLIILNMVTTANTGTGLITAEAVTDSVTIQNMDTTVITITGHNIAAAVADSLITQHVGTTGIMVTGLITAAADMGSDITPVTAIMATLVIQLATAGGITAKAAGDLLIIQDADTTVITVTGLITAVAATDSHTIPDMDIMDMPVTQAIMDIEVIRAITATTMLTTIWARTTLVQPLITKLGNMPDMLTTDTWGQLTSARLLTAVAEIHSSDMDLGHMGQRDTVSAGQPLAPPLSVGLTLAEPRLRTEFSNTLTKTRMAS
jgi:hypothetical protein